MSAVRSPSPIYHIVDLAEAIEERRDKVLGLLRPNREQLAAAVPTVAFVRPSGDK